MAKIYTILGTRPEIIRLSRIIPKLDELCEHTVIHTGQNYDERLNDIFFTELKIRQPDVFLGAKTGNFGEQIGVMFEKLETLLTENRPEKVLILGDTNSGLCAIVCERLGIPVYHMEAGNRCFDKRVPEEINRKLIDSISSFNLPYTQLSKENLLRDGVSKNKIFVTGNPIHEVLNYYSESIENSQVLKKLKLKPNNYFLSTFHRAENVDDHLTLKQIVGGLSLIASNYKIPVICSIHPRTMDKIKKWTIEVEDPNVRFYEPFGLFDFVKLESHAKCIISDSGTVAEESCILGVPNVIIRNTTERPEVIECGSNILAGTNCSKILNCTQLMTDMEAEWDIPEGYNVHDVSDRVVKILLGEHIK
jgi:UDP-N-acetylglucosamine 2-epimerase (non-hydrolysing)